MKNLFIILALLFSLIACKKQEDDNRFIGKWADGITVRQYFANGKYSDVYLTEGDEENPITADSVFGTYTVDKKENLLWMRRKGYRDASSGLVIESESSTETYQYSFKGKDLNLSNSYYQTQFTRID